MIKFRKRPEIPVKCPNIGAVARSAPMHRSGPPTVTVDPVRGALAVTVTVDG